MKVNEPFKQFSLSIVFTWMILFSFLPFCLVIGTSFMSHSEKSLIELPATFINYLQLNNAIYLRIFKNSFIIAGFCTLFCLILSYPFAYIIARIKSHWKNVLLLLVIIPFWTSSLIRSYALIAILKAKGILNSLLIGLGLIDQPLSILYTNYAVMIGLVYNLLPFMILPIMTNVERLDQRLIDAARDLGANRFTIFRKIIIPLTLPGIIAGSTLVFLPAMTLFYIADILGGAKSVLLGNLIQNQFLISQNWPMGSAFSALLTLVLLALILIYLWTARNNKKRDKGIF